MDVEKTIAFLLEQQARSEAQFGARMDRLAEEHIRHRELTGQLIGIMSQLGTEQRKLAASHRKTEEGLRALSDKVDSVTDNMNALIKVVDGLVRRNGKRKPPKA